MFSYNIIKLLGKTYLTQCLKISFLGSCPLTMPSGAGGSASAGASSGAAAAGASSGAGSGAGVSSSTTSSHISVGGTL